MTISSDAEQEHAIGLDDLIKLSDELSQKIRNFKKQGYKRLHGFVVTQSRGYWKAVRNINGKCVSVHLVLAGNTIPTPLNERY